MVNSSNKKSKNEFTAEASPKRYSGYEFPDFTIDSPKTNVNTSMKLMMNEQNFVSGDREFNHVLLDDVLGARSLPISLMDEEIETIAAHEGHPGHALQTMADGIPALGIVAGAIVLAGVTLIQRLREWKRNLKVGDMVFFGYTNGGRNTLALPFVAGSEPHALAPCHAGYVPADGYDGGGMDTAGSSGGDATAGDAPDPRAAGPSSDSIGDFFRRLMQ